MTSNLPPILTSDTDLAEAYRQQLQREKDDMVAAFDVAVQQNPETLAKQRKLAGELGLPTDTVARDFDFVEKFYRRDLLERAARRAANPALAVSLRNPAFAGLAQDDVETLEQTEGLFAWIGQQWDSGSLTRRRGVLGAKQAAGWASIDELDELQQIDRRLRRIPQRSGVAESLVGGTLEILGQWLPSIPGALVTGAAGAAPGLAAGPASPIAAGAGFGVGFAAGMTAQAMVTEGGGAYLDYVQAGYSPEDARKAAFGVGLVNGVLEAAGFKLASAPAKALLRRTVGKRLAKEMVETTTKSLWRDVAAEYFTAVGAEVVTEVMQEGVNMAGQELLRRYTRPELASLMATEKGREELTDRTLGIAQKTLEGMLLLGLPGPVRMFRHEARRADLVDKQTQILTALKEGAPVESKLLERAPDLFHQFVTDAAGGKVENLYIAAADLQNVLRQADASQSASGRADSEQSVTESLRAAAPQLLENLEQKARDGEDVVIPVADFLVHLARKDLGAQLMPHLRVDELSLSQAERDRTAPLLKQMAADASKVLAESVDTVKVVRESAKKVLERQIDELRAASSKLTNAEVRASARLYTDFVIVNAAKLKMTPEQFDAQFQGKTRRDPGDTQGPRLQQELVSYGTPQEGSDSVVGVHYSKEPRTSLSGEFYGSGMQGAESRRVTGDPTLSKRVSFYVDTGAGVDPETNVGTVRHEVRLDNVYNTDTDKRGLVQAWRDSGSRDFNELEQAIVNAGFDGIFVPRAQRVKPGSDATQGVVTLLGPKHTNVPVATSAPVLQQGASEGSRLKDPTPAMRKLVRNLTPEEQRKVTNKIAEKVIAHLENLPDAKEVAAVAVGGVAKRGWYRHSAEAISAVFGADGPRFAMLLAALSPQTSVEQNLQNALNAWKNWVAAGRPIEREAIVDVLATSVQGNRGRDSVLAAWIPNSVRALTSADPRESLLSGPKVNSFFRNLIGDVVEVTNDAWMANYALVDQAIFGGSLNALGTDPGKSTGYMAMSVRVREAAQLLTKLTGETWTPAEVQETVWSWAKTLYEMQTQDAGAVELLSSGVLTDELINSTPDFSSLFHLPQYAAVLNDAGYGQQLEALRSSASRGPDDGVARQEPRAGGEARPFAPEDQRRLQLRAARRLERLRRQRLDAEREGGLSGPAATGGQQADAGAVQDAGGVRRGSDLLAQQGRQELGPDEPLAGLPATVKVDGRDVTFGPFAPAREAARRYSERSGIPHEPPTSYVKVDPERATRIAQAFEAMPHDPQNADVKMAYDVMIAETLGQWQAIKETGLVVEFIDGADPYGNPRNAILDVVENNHLWVYPTDAGFGGSESANVDITGNPLLQVVEGETISGRPVRANDIFRIVHDYFGHVMEGVGFRAEGEENAWQQHMAMFSPLARKALTTETRGQNSWVNFGPFSAANRTANGAETQYAPQKIGLLPDWVLSEGYAGAPGALNQGDRKPRGFFDPESLTIFLTSEHNASTFLHELGHYFLTVYERLAAMPGAPAEVREDMQTLLDWFGVPDLATWSSMSLDAQRKHHEAFAYSFEVYLFEGKAPSKPQQRLFDRLMDWLRRTYTTILTELNVVYKKENGVDLPALTPEVRQVMDRMLAAEREIQEAKATQAAVPLFQSKEEFLKGPGRTEDDWEKLQKAAAEADDAAVARLTEDSMRQMVWARNARSRVLRRLQAEKNVVRERLREEVAPEIALLPVYRAMTWLTSGRMIDPSGAQVGETDTKHRLRTEAVQAAVPAGVDSSLLKRFTAKDGVAPDDIAPMFQFENGQDLVNTLLESPTLEEAIDDAVQQRLLEEYGELTDPQQIERAVDRAMHDEARSRFVAAELRHLTRAGEPVRIMLAAAKLAAQQSIGERQVNSINSRQFVVAERRASQRAVEAMKNGDELGVIAAKRQQLLQGELALAAADASREVEDALRDFKKLTQPDDKLGKNREIGLIAAARAILAAFGVGGTKEQRAALVTRSAELLAQIQAYDPAMFTEIQQLISRATAGANDYRQLSLNEFHLMRDTVMSLWFQSKRAKQLEIDGRLVDRDNAVGEILVDLSRMIPKDPAAGTSAAPGAKDKLVRRLQGMRSAARRAESLLDYLGPSPTAYLFRPIQGALDRYRTARNSYVARFVKLLDGLGELPLGKIEAKEIGYTFGNGNGGLGIVELLGALLHTGNHSNLAKLLVGRGWADPQSPFDEDGNLNSARWDTLIERLEREGVVTKAHWDFVQAVWDLTEEMKPMAQRAHKALFGHYFDEVKARPVPTSFGVYRGGYVPAKTDPFLVRDARINAGMEELEADFRQSMPTVGMGFTKARVEDYRRPLSLDVRLIATHLDGVTRFSHVQPAIRDVLSVLKDQRVANALERIDPTMLEGTLLPWLTRAARQQNEQAGMDPTIDKFWRAVRSRTGMATMFLNLSNAAQQLTGWFPAALKVKGSYLRGALGRYKGAPKEMAAEVSALSGFMDNRLKNQLFDLTSAINEVMLNPSRFERLQKWSSKHTYVLQSAMQNMVDVVTWAGAYEQAAGSGTSQQDAIAKADAAVRLTQGSNDPDAVSRYEAGTPFVKTLTQFSGYFNMLANLNLTEFARTVRDLGWRGGAGTLFFAFLFGFAAPMLVSDAIARTFSGEWDDEDDDGYGDEVASWLFGGLGRGALALVPFGTAAAPLVNAWNNKPYDDRMMTSPAVSAIEAATVGVIRTVRAAWDPEREREVTGKGVRDVLTLLTLLTGLPVSALGRPIGYGLDVAAGRTEPYGVADAVRGAVTGRPAPGTRQP